MPTRRILTASLLAATVTAACNDGEDGTFKDDTNIPDDTDTDDTDTDGTDTDDTGTGDEALDLTSPCTGEEDVRARLEAALGEGDLEQMALMRFDRDVFEQAVEQGRAVELPAVAKNGEIAQVTTTPSQVDLTRGRVIDRMSKDPQGLIEPLEGETASTWRMGCDGVEPCGSMAWLSADPDKETGLLYEGMVIDEDHGWTLYESARSLLRNLGEAQLGEIDPACGVVYHASMHGPVPMVEYDVEKLDEVLEGGPVSAEIPIVLDSDSAHTAIDPATVFSRQASLLAGVNLIYAFIEPLSGNPSQIQFRIKGQEAWIDDAGPDSLDVFTRRDAINDVDYTMVTPPKGNDELSYHYVGSDLNGGIAGIAGGICNYDGYDDTFASTVPNPDTHALGQQVEDIDGGYAFATLYGRTVVMAHEIAHMLGGLHGQGKTSACAGDTLGTLCGNSIMKSGAAGGVAPDFRQPFFTDDNDDRIARCVDEVY